jgi:hypothetical protein
MSGPPDEQPPSWQQPQQQPPPQWQQQQPQWGEQQHPQQWQGPGGSGGTSGLAIASLILGIVSLPMGCFAAFGLLCSVPAVITGVMARRNIRDSGGRVGGDGLALAGIITGGLGIAWALLWTILIIIGTVNSPG